LKGRGLDKKEDKEFGGSEIDVKSQMQRRSQRAKLQYK
jgi:hypothetical protein